MINIQAFGGRVVACMDFLSFVPVNQFDSKIKGTKTYIEEK
jgi:hypothetical protein